MHATGQTPLSRACLNNDVEKVKELIKEDSSCVLEKNWNRSIALCVAAGFSKLKIVKIVLKATPKAKRSSMNQYHDNAYDYAYRYREEDTEERRAIIKLLKKAGLTSCARGYDECVAGLGIVHSARSGERTWE